MINEAEKTICSFFESQYYKNLFPLLNSSSCNYAAIKGKPLLLQAYKTPRFKISADIDILISKKDLKTIEDILRKNGYACSDNSRTTKILLMTKSHQTAPWIKSFNGVADCIVDINFDLFWGEYEGGRIDIDEFLSDTIEMNIYGQLVKTLPPLKALVQLALHHYKDMNSIFLLATRNCIKQDMFIDVYNLIVNNLDCITPEALSKMCEKYRMLPYMYYILYYTKQVCHESILDKYIDSVKTSKGVHLLNCYGLCSEERKEWSVDFFTRLNSENLFELIKNDLNDKDLEKLSINSRVFM